MNNAQIYDRGFRRYDGERTGTIGASKTLIKESVRQSLGLGRLARHKVLPLAIIVMAFLPAISFVGFAALIPAGTEEFLPSYAEYYGFIAAAIYLLAGLIGPELLCSDRRTGMLGVYLASPLNRAQYLIGKAISLFLMLLIVTLGPPLLMLIAFSLQDLGPTSIASWFGVLGKVLASSALVGAIYGAVGMAISAATDRKAVATAAILAIFPGSAIVTDELVGQADVNPLLRLGNLMFLPRALVFRIHGERGGWSTSENPTWTLWLACIGLFVLCVGWIWFSYRKMLVRR